MGVEVALVRSTEAHAEEAVANLRPEDMADLRRDHGGPILQAARLALHRADAALTLFVDGQVVAIYGLETVDVGPSCAWLLATRWADEFPKQFLRASRRVAKAALRSAPFFVGFVRASNEKTMRLVSWLGGELGAAAPHGASGDAHHLVVFRRR